MQLIDPHLPMPSLSETLTSTIRSRPGEVILSSPTGDVTWSQVNQNANKLIAHFEAVGILPSLKYILIALPMGEFFFSSVIAAIKLAIPYIPIATGKGSGFDLQSLAFDAREVCIIDQVLVLRSRAISDPHDFPFVACKETDPLYGVMTSGSTGQPKIPLIPRCAIELLAAAFRDTYATEDLVWSSIHVPTFGFSTLEYFMPMLLHGRCFVPPAVESSGANGPMNLASALVAGSVCDVVCLTPSGFHLFLTLLKGQSMAQLPKFIVLSGEDLSPRLLADWFSLACSAQTQLINTYASAEAGGQVFWKTLSADSSARDLGQPLPHVEFWLVDEEHGVLDGPATGRLAIRSSATMIGDLNNDAERYVNLDHSGAPVRAFLTDDLVARNAEDACFYVGRLGSLQKHQGRLIDVAKTSQLIEEVLGLRHVKTRLVEVSDGRKRLVSFGLKGNDEKVQIWPALGEFNQYDRFTYGIMAQEGGITSRFIEAIQDQAASRTLLDVGCGSELLISGIAAAAGARHVLALEIDPDAAAHASQMAMDHHLDAVIEVVCADAAVIEGPIDADVAINRIFGNIASADGVIRVVKNLNRIARRKLHWLPGIARTKIAAIELGDLSSEIFRVTDDAELFFQKLESRLAHPYRSRICLRNFDPRAIVTQISDFEILDFNSDTYHLLPQIDLAVRRDAVLSGLLLWVQTESGGLIYDDFLNAQKGWLPVYLPVLSDGLEVREGDHLLLQVESPNYFEASPDYRFVLTVMRGGALLHRQRFSSDHVAAKPQSWHRLVDAIRGSSDLRDARDELDRHLLRLRRIWGDECSVPDLVIPVDAFPLTVNGKTDYKALDDLVRQRDRASASSLDGAIGLGHALADATALLHRVLAVMRQSLAVHLDPETNLFQAGASSLDIAAMASRLSTLLEIPVPVSLVYDCPSAQQLSARLFGEYGVAAQPSSPPLQVNPSPERRVHGDCVQSGEIAGLDRFDLRVFEASCPAHVFTKPAQALSHLAPVFVLSAPRTGLEGVLRLLDSHLHAPPVVALDLLRFDGLSQWLQGCDPEANPSSGLGRHIMASLDCSEQQASATLADWLATDLEIEAVYERLFPSAPGCAFVEVSSLYALSPGLLARIKALFPACRIIHVFSDPRAGLEDCGLELPGLAPSLMEAYAPRQRSELIWCSAHQNLLRFARDLERDRYLCLSRSQLTEQPDLASARISALLGAIPAGVNPHCDPSAWITPNLGEGSPSAVAALSELTQSVLTRLWVSCHAQFGAALAPDAPPD